jgi:polar amino acid transport system substrate-binding protein
MCAAISVVLALGGRVSAAEPLRLVTNSYNGRLDETGNDKAPRGDIEVLRQVLATMGQEVSFEAFPPHRVWTMVASGERDGLTATLRTSERERVCSFPDEPLGEDRSVLFVRTADAGKLKFSSFDDLVGHDVAVGGSYPLGLSEHPLLSPELSEFLREHHNMVETSGTPESLRMLAAGRVDYAVACLDIAQGLIATTDLSGKIEPLLSRSITEQGVYVCFNKARVSPSFVGAFSRALRQFKQTETYQAIIRKYLL